MMMQLTTINGMNTPNEPESSGRKAFIIRSTMVVKDAITTMNIGIRTADGISFRNRLIISSLMSRTKVMASPIPIPFSTLVVIARPEHNPIMSVSSGFSRTIPFVNSSL